MLKQRARIIAICLYLVDITITLGSFFIAYALRNTLPAEIVYGVTIKKIYGLDVYLKLVPLIIPIWSIMLAGFGLYKSFRTKTIRSEIWQIVKVVFLGCLILGAGATALKYEFVSRLFIILFAGLNILSLSLARLFVMGLTRYIRKKGFNYRNILIVGTGGRARHIANLMKTHKEWGFKLLGFVSPNPDLNASQINGTNIIGTTSELPQILQHQKQPIDEIIFALPRKQLDDFENIFLLCEELGIKTMVAINFFPHMIAKVQLEEFQDIPLLTFTTTPTNEFHLFFKRVLDIIISFFSLLILLPLFIIIPILIKLTSKGPVFFRQKRVGLNGRQFTLYKFRSMTANAEVQQAALANLNEMDGPVFKIKNDPRLTKVGRFIRKTSIDELPQLWNVLKGDMSIVGPRPPIMEEVKQYQVWQRRRLSMKPGITCLWQVSGRNKIDFQRWMELDLEYIDNWSLGLDLKILFKTIPAVLLGKGAN